MTLKRLLPAAPVVRLRVLDTMTRGLRVAMALPLLLPRLLAPMVVLQLTLLLVRGVPLPAFRMVLTLRMLVVHPK